MIKYLLIYAYNLIDTHVVVFNVQVTSIRQVVEGLSVRTKHLVVRLEIEDVGVVNLIK